MKVSENRAQRARRLGSGDDGVTSGPPAAQRRRTDERGHLHAYVGALIWQGRRQGGTLRSSESHGDARVQTTLKNSETQTRANVDAHADGALEMLTAHTHATRARATHAGHTRHDGDVYGGSRHARDGKQEHGASTGEGEVHCSPRCGLQTSSSAP